MPVSGWPWNMRTTMSSYCAFEEYSWSTWRFATAPPTTKNMRCQPAIDDGGPDPADFFTSTQPLAESQAAMDFSNTRWSGRGGGA